jgi:uncharacterized iron-regulated protein
MKKLSVISILCIITLVAGMQSCRNKDVETISRLPVDSSQVAVLNNLTNIECRIAFSWDSATSVLRTATAAFISTPGAQTLLDAQNAWRAARTPWETNESFAFGPVGDLGIDGNSDDWPLDIAGINSLLGSSATLNDSLVSAQATNLKGFHAVEYILFGYDGTKTYTGFTARELQLLDALTLNLTEQSAKLKTQWTRGNNKFADNFATAGTGNSTYATTGDAIGEVLNAMADITNELPNSKIAQPLQTHNIYYAESPYSDNSINDYINNLLSVQAAYTGNYANIQGPGISTLVAAKNPKLDDQVRSQIMLCVALGQAFHQTFNNALTSSPSQLANWQTQIQRLNSLLDVQVRTVIGG